MISLRDVISKLAMAQLSGMMFGWGMNALISSISSRL
jgi:hypothetical protein